MNEKGELDEKQVFVAECSSPEGDDVLSAIRRRDWSCLRSLSLKPGGFGADRKHAWPYLMHAKQEANSPEDDETHSQTSPLRRRRRRRPSLPTEKENCDSDEEGGGDSRSPSVEPHPDERQIKLDTDRSFVLYSVDEVDREVLQDRLNNLITSVFRRHPRLSYFQGYHDIITVLFLTLPEDDQLLCAEQMSLHRLRDAMGKGLEPLLGLLQVLKYLLRLADPEYAALLERSTPLPYFALSNLLTLFSHDIPTLPLIQHVFDFLLCRPPIAIVYLAAAVTLLRKDEALRMENEGEEGMLHSLLSSLPELSDGDKLDGLRDESSNSNILQEEHLKPISIKNESISEPARTAPPETSGEDADVVSETNDVPLIVDQAGTQDGADRQESESTYSDVYPQMLEENETSGGSQHVRAISESSVQTDGSHSTILPGSSIASDLSSSGLQSSEPAETEKSSRPPSPQAPDRAPRQAASLPALLEHADTLFRQFPPSHLALYVSAIMGPQSVISTWSEDPNKLMSDAEAEALTGHPELVVLPFVDPDEAAAMKAAEKAASGPGGSRTRRKLRKPMRGKHFGVRFDKKTVLTGTVVALSVAVAVYSMRVKGNNGGVLDISRTDRTLRKTARVVSGILIGGSERLLETFGW